MDKKVTLPSRPVVFQQGQIKTTSLKVAEAFGKLHKDVIRKIGTIDCSPEFNERNFTPVEYTDGKGEKRPAFEMTKDGFMFLVMGFTGKKAAQIKEAYINAFNEMADRLNKPKRTTKTLPNGLTAEQQEAIKAMVKSRVEALPQGKRAKAAITCWSSLKSKFGCTYKAIEPDNFSEAVSLVARVPLEGEVLERGHCCPAGADDTNRLSMVEHHIQYIAKYWFQEIGPAVRQLNPSLYANLTEHIRIAGIHMKPFRGTALR